jgi:hypothetical protein
MRIPLRLEGFEDHHLAIETAGFFRGARILIDDQAPPRGQRPNHYVLRRSDGFKIVAELRQSFLDPVPRLLVDGRPITLAEPLPPIQWLWSGLPVALMFVGGALGGAIGVAAFWTNLRVFRSEFSGPEKYILCLSATPEPRPRRARAGRMPS